MNDVKIIDQTFHFGEDGRRAKGESYTQFVEAWAARLLPDLPEFGQNWELTNEREGLILWLDYVATGARGET